MEEQLIEFSTAILAREKGFEIPTCHWYNTNKEGTENNDKLRTAAPSNHNYKQWDWGTVSVPTQALLQKWLREVHKIDVLPTFSQFSRTYGYKYYLIENGKTECINHAFNKYDSYEKSLEFGLQEALKLLK